MTDTLNSDPLSGINLSSIQIAATQIAERAILAYWMEDRDAGTFEFHRREIPALICKLADLCGYELVKKTAAPASDQQHADAAETSIP